LALSLQRPLAQTTAPATGPAIAVVDASTPELVLQSFHDAMFAGDIDRTLALAQTGEADRQWIGSFTLMVRALIKLRACVRSQHLA
jgi:hypothetical protein